MTTYSYSIANDTLNGEADEAALTKEIVDAQQWSFSFYRVDVDVGADNIDINFAGALQPGEVTALTALVAAHDGHFAIKDARAIIMLCDEEVELNAVAPGAWDEIGGLIINPSIFVADVSSIRFLVTGQYRANQCGLHLRVAEVTDGLSVRDLVLHDVPLPDTSDALTSFSVHTSLSPNALLREFRLEGGKTQSGGQRTTMVRHVNMAIVEIEL